MQPSCEPLSTPAVDLGFSASARAQPSSSRRNLLLPSHVYIPGRTDTVCGWCWAGGHWDQTFPNTFPEPCQLQHTGIIAGTFPFPGPFPGPSPFFSPSPGHPSPGVSLQCSGHLLSLISPKTIQSAMETLSRCYLPHKGRSKSFPPSQGPFRGHRVPRGWADQGRAPEDTPGWWVLAQLPVRAQRYPKCICFTAVPSLHI